MPRFYSSQHRHRMAIYAAYLPGTHICVQKLNNVEIPDEKSLAMVKRVDTLGTLYIEFDNGARANVIPGIDTFRSLTEDEARRFRRIQT